MDITVQPTPNPNALKFILDQDVKTEGKTSFKNPNQAKDVPLAQALFDLRGVDQIHFFQNVITVSKFSFEPWDNLEPSIATTIENLIEDHDPNFKDHDPEKERRKSLSADMLEIEAILDKRIRPGLQADGGDLAVLSYEDNTLIVRYQGACGTCPSAFSGTLEAIRAIMRDEYDPEIEVYIAPEEGAGPSSFF
ncbi:MAG: NifU family protein [Bacteriovoracaceae bacterium]